MVDQILKWIIYLGVALAVLFIAIVVRADEIENLIPHIIATESSGNSNAVSPAGAIGLMGITPIVLKEWNEHQTKICNRVPYGAKYENFTVDLLYYPIVNKELGTWYLRRLKTHYLKENYTIERLLHAWNGGITKLRRYNYDCSKMPRESREFSEKVLKLYNLSQSK